MDDSDSPFCKHKDPNGFVNRVFNNPLDVEKEAGIMQIQDPDQRDPPGAHPSLEEREGERTESGRKPRNTGFWRILTRRRTAAGCERRPHSMILSGEASIPKLSFVDKVRSFKKLKSPSVFKGRTFKLHGAKGGNGGELEDEPSSWDCSSHTYFHRNPFRNKAMRHSYAGNAKDFDCSFEDVDLTSTSENEPQLHRDVQQSSNQNGFKPWEGASPTKKAHPSTSNCNNSAGLEEHSQGDFPKSPQGKRKSRRADVWSYLRKISLMGKGASSLSEKSFDSEFHTLDKTIDSDCASSDFECVRDFNPQPKPAVPDSKSGHFRGLFRIFSSVAETARKWRNSSRSFSPPEGETSPRERVQLTSAVAQCRPPPKWRKRRPASVYTLLLSLQCPTLQEGVVSSGQDGEESHLWKLRAGLGAQPESVSGRPLVRRRPHSVIDGSVPAETEPLHPLRPVSRPPGLSPRDPPFTATLQRCRSLPLSQSTPSGLEQAGLRHALPQSGDSTLKLQSEASWRCVGHMGTTRRRLLRPGSEQLHANMVTGPPLTCITQLSMILCDTLSTGNAAPPNPPRFLSDVCGQEILNR
ncbi:hypothetical protein MATL_G00170450 [Megalops atlanticus]|uniref:Uncharacterized protein n=1 Tax=Megalops atlanticus TaxID=7932 RepID=A0A9D3PPI0_MEGAT|nr:hypothetical protein MATL_G00170450 [Megalops atlanticus]